ncbi:PHP domain-containing protein [Desulfolucanica intricata]|uniref:PHP domain-containing protein n=1 Tax=Desulfolucanica intricata TaxID=1285191 RepID=UPI00082E5D57|nr:PHP domain-containing protein [Desulfolucanica intricata]
MSVDLHVHTSVSDGTDTPEQVVEQALSIGLEAIAITDHDILEGISAAQEAARGKNIEIVPGIELSTVYKQKEIHVLGYYIDRENEEFLNYLTIFRNARRERIIKITEKLLGLGINLDLERVMAIAGDGSAGRPHVAEAMVEIGAVSSMSEAFEKYIGFNGPAYVPRFKLSPTEAVKLILSAKGVPVLAHPGLDVNKSLISELIDAGIQGIEVYHPSHSWDQINLYTALARVNSLIITGGSDYHGQNNDERSRLGSVLVDYTVVKELKECARRNRL